MGLQKEANHVTKYSLSSTRPLLGRLSPDNFGQQRPRTTSRGGPHGRTGSPITAADRQCPRELDLSVYQFRGHFAAELDFRGTLLHYTLVHKAQCSTFSVYLLSAFVVSGVFIVSMFPHAIPHQKSLNLSHSQNGRSKDRTPSLRL